METKDILYKIQFFSDWHCGSGLAAGAEVDALVIKDKNGLPFVPGKTIKGLIREAYESISYFRNANNETDIITLFGENQGPESTTQGIVFFSNAELPESIAQQIIATEGLKQYMFRNIASTAIDPNGIAKDHSLRHIQTVIACELHGTIQNIPQDTIPLMSDALKYIKRLGLNRNRGLGRCQFSIVSIK